MKPMSCFLLLKYTDKNYTIVNEKFIALRDGDTIQNIDSTSS